MKEVIPGFEQGIIGTTKGTKKKIKIPAELAYGKKGGGDIKKFLPKKTGNGKKWKNNYESS